MHIITIIIILILMSRIIIILILIIIYKIDIKRVEMMSLFIVNMKWMR